MSVAANRYARALMDVLYPDHVEEGLEQLQKLSALLEEQPAATQVLENPTISAERRKALIAEIGDALVFGRPIRNLLNLLVERNRLNLLRDILPAYQTLMDEKMGIVRAQVTSAKVLDPVQQRELEAKLESVTGKQVRMEVSVDPSLIGGVVAQVGSTIYDGSLRQQLKTFKNRLVQD